MTENSDQNKTLTAGATPRVVAEERGATPASSTPRPTILPTGGIGAKPSGKK